VNQVEDALIRRIDGRRAITRALRDRPPRERTILRGLWHDDLTFAEVGLRHGITGTRVRQISLKAMDRMQAAVVAAPRTLPRYDLPAGFDRAAFLHHMRGLIRRRSEAREEAKEHAWKREMAVMDHFVSLATPKPPTPPQPPTPPLRISLPVSYVVTPPYTPPPSSAADLAEYALQMFMSIRQPYMPGNRSDVGAMCSTVMFSVVGPVQDETIAEAMRRLAAQIPEDATLSSRRMAGAPPLFVTAANDSVAIQAAVMSHIPATGQARYRFAVTWDQPNV
jgi:hypothetical protein